MKSTRVIGEWFVRIAVSAGFLSAVADRLGYWGAPGSANVGWGNMENFTVYSSQLNAWAPEILQLPLAWTATGLEVLLGVLLIIGFKLKWVALAISILLLIFFLAMFTYIGPKAPLDFSVLPASAAAFMLFVLRSHDD